MSPPSPRHALAQPRCCCRPRRRAVAATPLSAALSPAQSTSAVAPMVAGTCVARAHACVRYGAWEVRGRGVARTRRARPRSLCRRRASRSCLATRVIDVPLSGPKRQNSSEKGRARTTRGAGGRQTLPGGGPYMYRRLGPSVHRNSPHATLTQAPDRTLPTSAWIGFALLYSRLPEKGTKLKPWGAAMIKNKTMGMMP